jgi:predicted extracellular nuclease
MKRLFAVAVILSLGVGSIVAQYPLVTIMQIQKQPLDSLKLADSLQSISSSRWALQASPLMGDTVTVVALCVIPPKVMTFTQRGFSMLLYDTSQNATTWKGLFVRTSSDTTTHISDGFLNVKRGYLIGMTGVVSEFPAGVYNSVTQFQPIPGIPIVVLDTGLVIPQPIPLALGDFYIGKFPGGKVNFSVGEQYESMLVQFTDATVDAKVNTARGTFSMVDEVGNQIAEYDASKFFTLAGGTTDHSGPDSIWQVKFAELGVGTRVDTLKGMISTVS